MIQKIFINIKGAGSIVRKYAGPILPAVFMGVLAVGTLAQYQPSEPEQYQVLASENPINQELSSQEEETTEEAVVAGNFDLEDGVYRGTGIGYGGDVVVDVTIQDEAITKIDVISADKETASFFARAKKVIDTMLASQSADVDVVSGATYSSRGIISAVKNALFGETAEGSTASTNSTTAPSVSKIKESGEYKDGTYTGSANGFGGPIKVKVTVKNGKINKIEVTEASGEGDSYMKKAKGLIKTMVKKNTTNVDAVSGATYSSNGLIKAVRNALKKAKVTKKTTSSKETKTTKKKKETATTETKKDGTSVSSGEYNDGTYTGTGTGFRGNVSISLTIQNGKIVSIEINEKSDDEPFFTNAKEGIINNILKQQNTSVDTVTGATYSSKGLLEAINNALAKARKTAADTNAEATTERKEEETTSESTTESDLEKTTEEITEDTTEIVYLNGIYSVTSYCSQYKYYVSMDVTISESRITAIENVTHTSKSSDDAAYMEKAKEGIIPQVLEKGNASGIDVVTGATYSSKALIEGCRQAFTKAKKK